MHYFSILLLHQHNGVGSVKCLSKYPYSFSLTGKLIFSDFGLNTESSEEQKSNFYYRPETK